MRRRRAPSRRYSPESPFFSSPDDNDAVCVGSGFAGCAGAGARLGVATGAAGETLGAAIAVDVCVGATAGVGAMLGVATGAGAAAGAAVVAGCAAGMPSGRSSVRLVGAGVCGGVAGGATDTGAGAEEGGEDDVSARGAAGLSAAASGRSATTRAGALAETDCDGVAAIVLLDAGCVGVVTGAWIGADCVFTDSLEAGVDGDDASGVCVDADEVAGASSRWVSVTSSARSAAAFVATGGVARAAGAA